MIKEDYVSFEVAKLLKEKGFDVYGDGSFNSGIEVFAEYSPSGTFNKCIASKPHQKAYAAPTLQMTMKWLEIKKHIAIIPILSSILDNEKFLWDVKIVIAETGEKYSQGWVYENREQACEAAIKYCLENLI